MPRYPECGSLIFGGQLGAEASPLPLPTSRNWLSGETATAVGYQPTGMNPLTREIFSSRLEASSISLPEMSATITQFRSALATNKLLPSGETAKPQGVEPSGEDG